MQRRGLQIARNVLKACGIISLVAPAQAGRRDDKRFCCRHCEEHLRRSNPVLALSKTGLLRFARNDGAEQVST
jgi:hypothetical protein